MGDMLDQHEYFRDYRLTQKGKLLWDQIYMLHWYARDLCLRYDFTCCSRMNAPHLPFSCEFCRIKGFANLERFELYGACGDLNLPSLPTRDPPKPSMMRSKRQRDTSIYPGLGHLAV